MTPDSDERLAWPEAAGVGVLREFEDLSPKNVGRKTMASNVVAQITYRVVALARRIARIIPHISAVRIMPGQRLLNNAPTVARARESKISRDMVTPSGLLTFFDQLLEPFQFLAVNPLLLQYVEH